MSLMKNIQYGQAVGTIIKAENSKDDMKIIRCILGDNVKGVAGVLRFLGEYPKRYKNNAVQVGIWLELRK